MAVTVYARTYIDFANLRFNVAGHGNVDIPEYVNDWVVVAKLRLHPVGYNINMVVSAWGPVLNACYLWDVGGAGDTSGLTSIDAGHLAYFADDTQVNTGNIVWDGSSSSIYLDYLSNEG